MYETTSPETASFRIRIRALEWRPETPETFPEHYVPYQILLSDFYPEAGLYQRKVSLVDRILAIAESVPDKEWKKLPNDLAEKYRDYKRNTEK